MVHLELLADGVFVWVRLDEKQVECQAPVSDVIFSGRLGREVLFLCRGRFDALAKSEKSGFFVPRDYPASSIFSGREKRRILEF
jgi:hypothetical protein